MEQDKKVSETTSELTLEESFQKMEEILGELESRDITLEASFQKYKEGMELLKKCSEKLDLVEKKMQMMNEEGELCDFQE